MGEEAAMGILTGKRALVVGVANKRSMAWGIAQAMDREGAELALTYQMERFKENLDKLVGDLGRPVLEMPLDVTEEASLANLTATLQREWGQVDIVVHSVAHARTEDLSGRFVDTSREGWALALDVSAYSLVALTRACLPLFSEENGASVMTLTYLGSERVMPNYNVMGTAKAALEATVRYLAWDLGPMGVRVNALSPGPVKTLAATGVKGFSGMLHEIEERAPLRRNITPLDVGNAAVCLGSDWARNITGQVLFIDAGYHVMGI
jgi:enoyl-[acyl-carrier protein] reductase I